MQQKYNLETIAQEIKKLQFIKQFKDGLKNKQVFVGIRPFRKGGIRLQMEQIQNKSIIYNYGHGGAGISMSTGCGAEVAQLACKVCQQNKKVSILGSGIMGLMSAYFCAKKGLKVTIYADRIPQQNKRDPKLACTSQVAPGYWYPHYYDIKDYDQHMKRAQLSYNLYKQFAKKSAHIYYSTCFQEIDLDFIKKTCPKELVDTCKQTTLNIGNRQIKGVQFRTFQIDLPKFLQQLISKCQKYGVVFKNRKFNSFQEVMQLEDNVLIACLGVQSRYIFNDDNVYGLRGHLVQYEKNSDVRGVIGLESDTVFYVFPNRILIGMTKQYTDQKVQNKLMSQQIDKKAYSFYKTTIEVPKAKL